MAQNNEALVKSTAKEGRGEGGHSADREFDADLLGDYTIKAKNFSLELVPNEILTKKSAKVLLLSSNRLTCLPPQIGAISTLTVLKIEKNLIKELPRELGNLLCLVELQAGENLLNGLPTELGAIKTLQKIGLNGNPMMSELGDCGKTLWEVWYGDIAGPMPTSQHECQLRPAKSSGTTKMRTSFVLKILRRSMKGNIRGTLGPERVASKEPSDALRPDLSPRGSTHPSVAGEGTLCALPWSLKCKKAGDQPSSKVDLGGTSPSTSDAANSGGKIETAEGVEPTAPSKDKGAMRLLPTLDAAEPEKLSSSVPMVGEKPEQGENTGEKIKSASRSRRGRRGGRWKLILLGGAIVACGGAFLLRSVVLAEQQ
ncbi:hypothetical protein BSKO_05991 [Bryopsis sp. KO-2023]|nr:hypothetical protein BSKO_05991 [Bryopsis sp. KO-2023]